MFGFGEATLATVSIIANLLETRASILKELSDVEGLLRARGWKETETPAAAIKDTPPAEAAPKVVAEVPKGEPLNADAFWDDPKTSDAPKKPDIAYRQEAQEWLKTVEGEITGIQFRRWLVAKYGEDAINEQSVRGPFPLLVKTGVLEVLRNGVGRSPSIYRKAS